jgi:hypothetical protein
MEIGLTGILQLNSNGRRDNYSLTITSVTGSDIYLVSIYCQLLFGLINLFYVFNLNKLGVIYVQFIGHVMTRDGLKNIGTTGKIEGRTGRGRQREKMLDNLIAWHGMRSTENIFRCMADRGLWPSTPLSMALKIM